MTSSLKHPLPTVRRAFRRACCCLGFGLLAFNLAVREASARDQVLTSEERAAARTAVAEASHAFEAGDFERALTHFDRAAQVVDVPTIALMQARTLVALGRLVAAVERYTAAQRTDPVDSGNAAFQSAAKEAAHELGALKERIPTLRIRLAGTESKGAQVGIDGRPLAPEAVMADQLLDPGPHEVEVRTATGSAVSRTVTLTDGAREQLVFSLESTVRVQTSAAPPATAPPRADEAQNPRIGAWVALGSGVAFTGAGAVLGVLALGHKSELDAVCGSGCPAEYEDTVRAFRVERTLSYVGFALGATGVGAGLYLLMRSEPGAATTALALTPSGVSLSGRFQ